MAERHQGFEDRLAELAGHLNAVHARIVETIDQVLETGAWGVDGIRSPTHWLTWQLGITSNEADRLIRLARARHTHPVITAMFDEGRLSLTQAAIATSVTARRDAEIAEVVEACTISQLRLFTKAMAGSDRRAAQQARPEPDPAPARTESFDFGTAADGWMNGRFDLDPEHAAIVGSALEHARDDLFHRRADAADPATGDAVAGRRISWADALVEMAQRSLDAEPSTSRQNRFRINVFIDPTADQRFTWSDQSPVPDWLADKLSCDGTISPVFTADAKPVSVGRSQRIVADRTRRLVLHRDGHQCRVPWCQRRRWLDAHHLVHWQHGGTTDTPNLISICNTCHDHVHRGLLHITGDADQPLGLTFTDRHHRPIDYVTRPHPPDRPPPEPTRPYVHPYGERLLRDDVWANPPPNNASAA